MRPPTPQRRPKGGEQCNKPTRPSAAGPSNQRRRILLAAHKRLAHGHAGSGNSGLGISRTAILSSLDYHLFHSSTLLYPAGASVCLPERDGYLYRRSPSPCSFARGTDSGSVGSSKGAHLTRTVPTLLPVRTTHDTLLQQQLGWIRPAACIWVPLLRICSAIGTGESCFFGRGRSLATA